MTDSTSSTIGLPYDRSNTSLLIFGSMNNNNDFVVETWDFKGGKSENNSFIYKGGSYIPQNYPGAAGTEPRGINDSGQVVGGYFANTTGNDYRGYIYDGSGYRTVEVPGSVSNGAGDINNSGTIVGGYTDRNSVEHGYIYSNGTYTTVDVPGTKSTVFNGVNDKGQAVGSYTTGSNGYSGFVYSNGQIQTLNYPGAATTFLNDINNDGTIVGTATGQSGTDNPAGAIGFIYKDGVFTRVQGSASVTGINDRGQVLSQGDDGKLSLANPLCFGSGTLIRTTRGDVPVEALAVGDVAITATGARRPIRWIGCRTLDCSASSRPSAVWPVRVRAGAFGPGLPARDLRLSPGHPVLVGADADGRGGVLVPIMCLINGTTIEREPTAAVTYWHVELDAHDLLLAEGFPAESYYDMGSRPWFAGEDGPLIDPDFVPAGEHGRCRPVAVDGPQVEAERLRLSALFAATLGAQCGWDEADSFAWLAA